MVFTALLAAVGATIVGWFMPLTPGEHTIIIFLIMYIAKHELKEDNN